MSVSDWNRKIVDDFRAKGGTGVAHPLGDRLLLLHVRGRRSGETRVYPLAYHRDGDRYVVAGSKGGSPEHPDWYRNVVAHRDVTVEVGTETFRARAIPLSRGPERERLWREHVRQMPGFAEYEKRTHRVIPVVALERA